MSRPCPPRRPYPPLLTLARSNTEAPCPCICVFPPPGVPILPITLPNVAQVFLGSKRMMGRLLVSEWIGGSVLPA